MSRNISTQMSMLYYTNMSKNSLNEGAGEDKSIIKEQQRSKVLDSNSVTWTRTISQLSH